MSSLGQIAAELADQTMPIMDATGNDRLYYEVAKVLGASSQTLEEAYLTEIRVRLAGNKARDFLKDKALSAGLSLATTPAAPQPTPPKPVDPAIKAASLQALTGRPPVNSSGGQ
ncbi:hypothetical protein [Halocynthiibacter styelae]|uniref:hypothetical protein n=1 Tax=Halocynthiibacter styelae TaxID=2761955 RepID=UPI002B4B9631|nr:hypothetical protein [Paenihalocynthiibacter styelae]